ncbi:MAG: hypothetical protein JJE25_11280 [Bacteroidia bacterium]|nr:hypothetical protein [Bacteroidia bacterium]
MQNKQNNFFAAKTRINTDYYVSRLRHKAKKLHTFHFHSCGIRNHIASNEGKFN